MPCLRAQVLPQDSLALVAFYNSTGGPNWTNHSGWLTGPVNTWYGVTVENPRVVKLIIYNNNMIGNISSDIGNLSALQVLSLGNDAGLSGEIPQEVYQLSDLKILGFYNCLVNGTISNEIGNLINLIELTIRQTIITGSIPPEIGNLDSLLILDLHDNQLSGSIPPELSNLTNLDELRLNDNQLTGTIPSTLTNCSKLSVLYLSNNRLTGSLPENFSSFFLNDKRPISLDVSHNELGDSIPESWGGLCFLIDALDISYNHFSYLPVICSWIITFFNIEGNKLTFDYLEPHYYAYQAGSYYFFNFYPQDNIGTEIDTALAKGSNYYIYSGTGGEYCNYKWYKNGELILESPEADTLHLNNITDADTGIYSCVVENTLVPMLLYRRPVHISITTVGIEELPDQNVTVYPNPCRDMLTLQFSTVHKNCSVMVYTMQGQAVYNKEATDIRNNILKLDLGYLTKGQYILQLKLNNSIYTKKITLY
jgi:hypothetical protein